MLSIVLIKWARKVSFYSLSLLILSVLCSSVSTLSNLCCFLVFRNKKNREDVGSFTDSALSDSTSSSRIPKPYANYAVPFYYPATRSVSSLPFSDMPIYMQDLTLADTEESASAYI